MASRSFQPSMWPANTLGFLVAMDQGPQVDAHWSHKSAEPDISSGYFLALDEERQHWLTGCLSPDRAAAPLVVNLFLAHSINVTPAGPKMGRSNMIDMAESAAIASRDQYTEWHGVVDGVSGTFMEMRAPKPKMNRKYRLAWNLPNGRANSGVQRRPVLYPRGALRRGETT